MPYNETVTYEKEMKFVCINFILSKSLGLQLKATFGKISIVLVNFVPISSIWSWNVIYISKQTKQTICS